jgi:hypothetical protein
MHRAGILPFVLLLATSNGAGGQGVAAPPRGEDATVVVEPAVVPLPPDRAPIDRWPEFQPTKEVGRVTLAVTYRAGAAGFPKGGVLRFGFGYPGGDGASALFAANGGFLPGPCYWLKQFPLGTFQTDDPRAPDFVSARGSKEGAVAHARLVKSNTQVDNLLEVRVVVALAAGDTIAVVFGDRGGGSPGAALSFHPGRPTAFVLADPTASGAFARAAARLPEVLFTGAQVDALHVTVPATPRANEPFRFTVQAFQGRDDSPDANIVEVENARGRVTFASSDPKAELPPPALLRGDERGVLSLRATFRSAGPQWIRAAFQADGAAAPLPECFSNPAWVDAPLPFQILVGDLHRHSAEGGHAGVTALYCWPQLWNRRDDFGAVLPHVSSRWSGFRHVNAVARAFQHEFDPEEREFVAFPAVEWTLPGAHRHVVWREFTDERAPCDRAYRGEESPPPLEVETLAGLFEWLERRDPAASPVLAVAHHPLWVGEDPVDGTYEWAPRPFEPRQPLVEIYGEHGSSERLVPDGVADPYLIKHHAASQRPANERASVADGLALGYRFGLVGGSDNHGYGLYQRRHELDETQNYGRRGLAFVLGDRSLARLRERVFDGLLKRRTYATTGVRALLSFAARDGTPMGGEVAADGPVGFRIAAVAAGLGRREPARFRRGELVRDGATVVKSEEFGDAGGTNGKGVLDLDWSDPSPIRDGKAHSYHLKLVQDDLNLVWSSPIWWTLP